MAAPSLPPPGARGRALGTAIPALLLPLLIVGGGRFGVFTATEAGAIALVYAILCAILPFILALVTVLMLVTYVPSLTLAPLRWLGP
jgi:TRAP-type C4-dicarboxylate transport system permease large subunit